MDIKELEQRIEKKKAQIAKIEKRVAKWEAAKSEAAYIKDDASWYSREPKKIKTMDQLIQARSESMNEPIETSKAFIEHSYEGYLKNCDVEIKHANRDLEDAKAQLAKYDINLGKETDKSKIEKIPVIVEFLNHWKEEAIDYVLTDGLESVKRFREASRKHADFHNNMWSLKKSKSPEEIANMKKEINDEYEEAQKNQSQLALACLSRDYSHYDKDGKVEYSIDKDKLNELLDKECDAKYFDLVNKIEKYAGKIVDASNLSVSGSGALNGIVKGELNNVRVETIYAGGYNIQRLHYRTLVHII